MYCKHKCFHVLVEILVDVEVQCNVLFPRPYGGAYSHSPIPQLEQDVGMGHLSSHPLPQTGNPGSITEIECTLLSGSAEQDALTMKESPLKNLILFFLRPHPSWGWLQNDYCLYLYQSLHHHLLLKCLTLAPTNNPYTNTMCMKLFTLWRYHTYGKVSEKRDLACIIKKHNKNALRLKCYNFRRVNAIVFLFSALHITPFLYGKILFGILHLLLASIATFDTPPGSNPP